MRRWMTGARRPAARWPGWMRRAARVTVSALGLVLLGAARSWLRNLRTAAPALGTLYIVLQLAGAGGLGALAARDAVAADLRDAAAVRVYLRQDVAAEAVEGLGERLGRDPRVAAVTYVSADRALEQARRRPGLARLAEAAGTNPFPARLEIRAAGVSDVAGVVAAVSGDPAVDPAQPTSYDPGTDAAVRRVVDVGSWVALGVLATLVLVATAVTANAIRAVAIARSTELAITRLLGAGRLVLYGPFLVEGALTGLVAGVIAAGGLVGLFAGAEQVGARLYTVLLPGVGWWMALAVAALLPAAGAGLGSMGALFGVRGRAAT